MVPTYNRDVAKMIFVFGSNLAGIHGAGAARFAKDQRGARLGVGEGLTGTCYALPTKDIQIRTLPLSIVEGHINKFLMFAAKHGEFDFQVTRIGCGFAGYEDEEIAPLFKNAPCNCFFDQAWEKFLHPNAQFWGQHNA